MRCVDVNVLVYAHREDSRDHEAYRDRLLTWCNDRDEQIGIPDIVLTGFIRIMTNRRIFREPTEAAVVWSNVADLLDSPAARLLRPGRTHWERFTQLSMQIDAKGDDITDAYIAGYAAENNATLISADRGFRRFDGIRYQHPLA